MEKNLRKYRVKYQQWRSDVVVEKIVMAPNEAGASAMLLILGIIPLSIEVIGTDPDRVQPVATSIEREIEPDRSVQGIPMPAYLKWLLGVFILVLTGLCIAFVPYHSATHYVNRRTAQTTISNTYFGIFTWRGASPYQRTEIKGDDKRLTAPDVNYPKRIYVCKIYDFPFGHQNWPVPLGQRIDIRFSKLFMFTRYAANIPNDEYARLMEERIKIWNSDLIENGPYKMFDDLWNSDVKKFSRLIVPDVL